MKRELLWIPVFGWALRMLQSIEVDRNAPSAAAKLLLKQGTQHLREGRWIVIFPEGTRVAPGSRGRYNVGGAWLAAHSGYPIFPIAHNAGYCWPRRGFIKYPGTIQLVIGPPIPSAGQKPQTLIRLTEDWIEETMVQLDQANESPSGRC
jgi:1-acyl-sn-glycerol-3-phosphate acyltransferase